jgi:hypothetical protein
MITKTQAQELLVENKIQSYDGIFYYDNQNVDTLNVLEKNGLDVAFSEWWDVFFARQWKLEKALGKVNTIPIITEEECLSMSL